VALLSTPLKPLEVKREVQTTLYGLSVPKERENTSGTTYVDHVDVYMTYLLVKTRTLFFLYSIEVGNPRALLYPTPCFSNKI